MRACLGAQSAEDSCTIVLVCIYDAAYTQALATSITSAWPVLLEWSLQHDLPSVKDRVGGVRRHPSCRRAKVSHSNQGEQLTVERAFLVCGQLQGPDVLYQGPCMLPARSQLVTVVQQSKVRSCDKSLLHAGGKPNMQCPDPARSADDRGDLRKL